VLENLFCVCFADFSQPFKCTTSSPDIQVNLFLSSNMDNTEVIVHQTKPVEIMKSKNNGVIGDKSKRLRHPADKGTC
jgi:hypothetical protein